jgi:lysophospholipase L1-like esterase
MDRRQVLAGLGLSLLAAACGGPPINPTPIEPPPTPTPTPTPPPATPPTLKVTRILAFGDSMTEGTTSPGISMLRPLDAGRSESYPFKLQTMLTERYTAQSIQVFNAGLAGRRAAQDRSRLIDAIRATNPEVLLLLEGANDLNAVGNRDAISPTIGALEGLIGEGTSRGVTVYVATLPPQRPDAPKAGAADFLDDFNAEILKMAPEEGARSVDIFAKLDLNLIGQDGLHPTEAGYQRMAEIWFEALKAAYEVAPTPTLRSSSAQ